MYLVQHDRIGLVICAVLIALAIRVWRVSTKTARDLDMILGPDRLAHVQQDRAWRRINR